MGNEKKKQKQGNGMLSQRSGSNGTNDNTKIKVELPIYDYVMV